MSLEIKKHLPTITTILQNLVYILTIISILGIGIIYTYYYNVPLLKYDTIQSYGFDSMRVSGITLRNEGHNIAREITIFIELDQPIKNYYIPPDEPFTIYSGGKNQKEIGIKYDKLLAGSSINLYLLTDENPNVITKIKYANGFAEQGFSSTITGETYWSSIVLAIIVTILIVIFLSYQRFKNLMEKIRENLNAEIIDKSVDFDEIDWMALGLASSNLIKNYLDAGEIKNGRTFQYHLVKDYLVPKGDKIDRTSIYELAKKIKVTKKFVNDLLVTLEKYRLIITKEDNQQIMVTDFGKKTFDFVSFYLDRGVEMDMFKPLSENSIKPLCTKCVICGNQIPSGDLCELCKNNKELSQKLTMQQTEIETMKLQMDLINEALKAKTEK